MERKSVIDQNTPMSIGMLKCCVFQENVHTPIVPAYNSISQPQYPHINPHDWGALSDLHFEHRTGRLGKKGKKDYTDIAQKCVERLKHQYALSDHKVKANIDILADLLSRGLVKVRDIRNTDDGVEIRNAFVSHMGYITYGSPY